MAFPQGYRLIGGFYYKLGDRSGPYVIDSDGNASLLSVGGASSTSFIPTLQRATPNDGDTVTVDQTASVVTLLIEGSQALNLLRIVLPQPGASSPGQVVRIVSWVDVASVDYGEANVNGADSQLFSGDGIALQNIEDNDWLKLP